MSFTKTEREIVYQKYDGHCAYCGKKIEYKDMQIDHFKPLRAWNSEDSGSNEMSNLMPSCRRCNHYKRANKLETFRYYLLDMKHKVLDDTYLGKVAMDYWMVTWNGWDGKFYFEKINEESRNESN